MNSAQWEMLGFLAGQKLRDMRKVQKEPVAYLYSGVELPAIPEWDKTKYPYAFLYKSGFGFYRFYAYDTAPYWNGYGLTFAQSGIETDSMLEDGSWGKLYEGTHPAYSDATKWPFWANFDLLAEDGSVYLAASEPVPVYE